MNGDSRFERSRQVQSQIIMLQPFFFRVALIFIYSTLAVLAVSCREDKQTANNDGKQQPEPTALSAIATPTTTPEPTASPQPQPVEVSDPTKPGAFEFGLDKAASAYTISQSAQSAEDWILVVSQYEDAITFMKLVERENPYFANAQSKIVEYQRQIQYAQKQASSPPSPLPPVEVKRKEPQKIVVPKPSPIAKNPQPPQPVVVEEKPPQPSPTFLPPVLSPQQVLAASTTTKRNEGVVFAAPIKRRIGGTPIIDVTFNGNQQFEMILDTGASGTVITQDMANAMGVVPVGKAKANTASAKAVEFPIGYVNSIEVGGVAVKKVAVAIAGSELETGLLGHDFFGDYDITIKRDVVEFRPPSYSQQLNTPQTRLTVPTSPQPQSLGEYP